jgi:transposase
MEQTTKRLIPKAVLGVDISKYTIDVAVLGPHLPISTHKIAHTEEAIRQFLRQQISELRCRPNEMLVCAEDMGVFCHFLIKETLRKKIPLWLEGPLQIKKSLGIARGKNDEIDAVRIAEYAKKNIDRVRLFEPPRECLVLLQKLTAIRNRLLKTRKILLGEVKVNDYFLSKQRSYELSENFSRSVAAINEDIKAVNIRLDSVVRSDPKLARLVGLITSVPCIGQIIAIQIIIHTNEFHKIATARQFACYCGIAPFERSSGGVQLGRARVSTFANKEIKANLHLAAIGCLRRKDSFLCQYYVRKQTEGKHSMSILNAIKNKLVHRVFACVNHDSLYSE